MRRQCIVMVGTALETRGGVSSVVNVYRDAGLFEKWAIIYITSHVNGSSFQKCAAAVKAVVLFTWLLVSREISVVHIHSASNASFWRKAVFVWIASMARRALIFHLHGGGFVDFFRRRGSLGKYVICRTLHQADRIVVLSERWKEEIKHITKNNPVVVIGNPVLIREIGQTLERRNLNAILFLGRIEAEKGIFDLVDAFAKIVIDHPKAVLLVAGEGEVSSLEARARSYGLGEKILILGWVDGEEKEKVLSQAGVLVLPSYFEGMPMGILEAMAFGMPIVASRVGAIPEVVADGVEGILVNPGDIHALSRALKTLLGNEDMQTRMGQAGQNKIATCYAISRVIPEIEKLYFELGALPVPDAGTYVA